MGLDMYLERHRYVKNWDHDPEKKVVTLTVDGDTIPLTNVKYVVEELGYWRKANQIHNYFVEQCADGKDECQQIYVSDEQIQELYRRCEAVLSDHSLASTLLPTQSGFFFGGTEYDEYYFTDLEDTMKILLPILNEPNAEGEIYYQASW